MSGSTLNPPGESRPGTGIGHSIAELGPSDSSDSGSDVLGAVRHPSDIEDALDGHALGEGPLEFGSDTDLGGTGERASADGDGNLRLDGDILPDSVESLADIADDSALPEDVADEAAAADAAAREADRT
ncbi:MAG: chemotaxis protein [Janthinobacterium lividum]